MSNPNSKPAPFNLPDNVADAVLRFLMRFDELFDENGQRRKPLATPAGSHRGGRHHAGSTGAAK